ncbi:MAG: AAA domain-containing protein [Candidatus Latescibacteria bacterium]|nr:AAA domain-containing protein [Candidatus Latescibacterota bacterium]
MPETPSDLAGDDDLQRRLFELQALHDISRDIDPLQAPTAILRVVGLTVAGTLGTPLTVGLWRPQVEAPLERVFSMGLADRAQDDLVATLADTPQEQTGATVLRLTPTASEPLAAGLYQGGFRLWIPWILDGQPRGGLGLGGRLSDTSYNDDDVHLLETIQSLVQQALHNAELYQAQQTANAELARLNQMLEHQVQDRTDALDAATQALSQDAEEGELLGGSPALQRVMHQLRGVAATDLTVLLLGQTGTGKSLAARALHKMSPRRDGPCITVNCGALPDHLVESELFGHEKGAFTGATARKIGKVELAQEGTLFLDEIGDLPFDAQVKLLRLLEERVFERVGGTQTLESQVRIVAATNRDLETMVQAKEFRDDLFYRLQVFPVELPPLRERPEDIPLLAQIMLERFAQRLHRPAPVLLPEALKALQAALWPGNVRELEHALQRAVLICTDDQIATADVGLTPSVPTSPSRTTAAEVPLVSLAENERRHLQQALQACDGTLYGEKGAARLLQVHPETLRYRLKKHGLLRPRRR